MDTTFPDAVKLYPLKFQPFYKERVWGGTQMRDVLGRDVPHSAVPVGEAWEITDRDDAESVVANGELAGTGINGLLKFYRKDLVGSRGMKFERFPLLVKLIDAGEKLSLQVHPDENSCRELGGGAEPKTEMWYIISALPGAKIMAGLNRKATRLQILDLLDSPDVVSQLQVYNSQPGDAYFIASGTLHAIGAGNLILEIQQNSDTTYRISDWGRVGSDGKPRELHREKGLKAISFTNRTTSRIPGVVSQTSFNRKFDVVTLCPFFKVADLRLTSDWIDRTNGESFHLLSSVCNPFAVGNGECMVEAAPGETVLIPACFGSYTIKPLLDAGATVVKTTL